VRRVDDVGVREPQGDLDQVDFSWLTDWFERRRQRSTVLRRITASEDWLALAFGLAVALALALWLTWGAWGPHPPSGEDTLPHLIRAEFALGHLIPHGLIDGWHPAFILGYQEFLFIGPGFTWAVGVVRLLSLGLLSTAGAFKVVFIGSFVVLPLAVAFFARSFGLSRRAAGLSAVLTLAVNNPFGGVGLQGLFNVGLVAHQFGAIFFFLTLGGILRLVQEPRLRWTVFTGLSGAALLVSHGISVILLGPLVAIVILTHRTPVTSREIRSQRFEAIVRREVQAELRRREGAPGEEPPAENAEAAEPLPQAIRPQIDFKPLVLAGALACALAACILVPFVAHRDLRNVFTGWGTPALGERVGQIWRGAIMFRPGVAPIVLAGLVFGLYRAYEGKKYAFVMVVAPVAYLVVSHVALSMWPGNVAAVQLPNRGVGYVGILAMLPLAALIETITGPRRAGEVLAVAAAAAVVLLPLGNALAMAREQGEPAPQLEAAARELASRVPDGARFLTERYFPVEIERTKIINPDRWLAWRSGRNTLNNFNVESSTVTDAAFEAERMRDRPAEEIAASLSRLGVSHVVTISDEANRALMASPRFVQAWADAPLAIFAVVPREGQPEPGALLTADVPVRAQVVKAEAEALDLRVQADESGLGTIPIAWSPKWHARLDGRAVPILRGPDSLIGVALPPGDHTIALRFQRDTWDWLGLAITVGTAAGGAVWLLRRRPNLRVHR
jgi:hypothetical protein